MSRRATLLMEAEPYSSASGFINALLAEELSQSGHDCQGLYLQRPVSGDTFIPLATADRIRCLRGGLPAELAVYCDRGLGISLPSQASARRTVVLFHGLAGSPATWIGNPIIDRYWVLSSYMQELLTCVLTLPDWRRRRCLTPEAFQVVDRLEPVLPCVDEPDGDPRLRGGELPPHLLRSLEGGEDVVGHALQPGKPDWTAVCSILLLLNRMSKEHGLGQRFRLTVVARNFALVSHALASGPPEAQAARMGLEALGLRLEDVFIPIEHLNQKALFRLFRSARFGLAYNALPEPFGFYVLESVFNGCPIYTNGSGNHRHVLPPGHGIHVREDVGMALGNPNAYGEVAARIFADMQAPESNAVACQKGREYILRTFTRSAFSRSVRASLEQLRFPLPAPLPFEELEVRLAPVVRLLDAEGHVISDFENTKLSPEELGLLGEVRGLRAGQVLARPSLGRELATLQGLCSRGVLALQVPTPKAPPSR
ncbi:hypothetical protein [Archangium lansingense]|uniref:Glycosyl transferase family 1 domain-containing protein n=1 Tax=Archangium lansingense TaxID=2995310 RepID=A0ABT4ACL7_9BACT|nr:hypothetical protein [Archangium lansinium]MCY1079422.1 hypothetical protein [Archangium lansinium]